MKANVFGTTYKIHLISEPNQFMYENTADGYSDFASKEIYILKQDKSTRTYHHELIHSFLYECGLRRYAINEDLVEALTEIFERILEITKNGRYE